ncbi:NAD(P)H-dependent oxidoreductase [Rhodovulum sp. DZ06]|uniref:NAD(P)H-dependent oxidoreductase n=1 Tax=Rhodovulum sp. DZ06 TaxID=3425126 RepID=UPI003D34BCE7
MQRILAFDGHPAPGSLSGALIDAYAEGAREAGREVVVMRLSDMRFDPDFGAAAYTDAPSLEPDLEAFLAAFEGAEHIVMACPLWWGGWPAKLKGLFDRVLLPGRGFDPRDPHWTGLPKPLMTGRSASLMVTSDTPNWAFRLVYAHAFRKIMARQVFGFVGIRPMRWRNFAIARQASPETVARWIETARADGRKGR